MTLLPAWWVPSLLAVAVLGDALASLRPPRFIRDCLNGVGFPRDWWWALIVVKGLAGVGLIGGIWLPGFALAASAGVVAYFGCAVAAHLRARFLTRAFWVNCLGMLALSIAVVVGCLLIPA